MAENEEFEQKGDLGGGSSSGLPLNPLDGLDISPLANIPGALVPNMLSPGLLNSINSISNIASQNMLSPGLLNSINSIANSGTFAAVKNSRALALRRGFRQESGTPADYFGALESVVRSDPETGAALDAFVATAQRRGSFGLEYKSLQGDAARLADRFENDPDLERNTRLALEPVQELTGLHDELLLDLGGSLGWWEKIRRHQVSTAGILLGFTSGAVCFVVNAGGGDVSAPAAAYASLAAGAAVYLTVHKLEG